LADGLSTNNHKKINEILKKYDKNYDKKDFFDLQQKI